jgi:hypothetical protein
LEIDTILGNLEDTLRGDDAIEEPIEEPDTRITDSVEEVAE